MRGITGFFSINNTNFVSRQELLKMTSVLASKKPDSECIYYSDGIGLGSKKLNAYDLSNESKQPMESSSMRFVCVYNGKIYNSEDILKDLKLKHNVSCETEILLEAFTEWGVTFVNKLNGVFAIAIYDKQSRTLYLFRDRLGDRHLFYYWDGLNFVFASELESLLQVKSIRDSRQINNSAINDYLHLGYVPEPKTIYSNIRKFESGQTGIVSENGFRMESFWDVESCINKNAITNFNEAKCKLKENLISSVKSRIDDSVQFGTLFSGGVDSSLITAITVSSTNKKVNTFSVGFEGETSELKFAKQIADYLGTNHHEFVFSEKEVMDSIIEMQGFYYEPFATLNSVPLMLISKSAKDLASTVLCGEGGDELFMGYGAYRLANRVTKFSKLGVREIYDMLRRSIPSIREKMIPSSIKNKDHLKSHIFSQTQNFFSELEINKILNPECRASVGIEQDFSNFVRKLTPAEAQSVFDIMYYLKDDLLNEIYRLSSGYSIDIRTPLLDYRIVELALNIDPKLKISKGVHKYLLKEVLYDYIPKDFFDRDANKFVLPLHRWLRDDMAYLIDEYLNKNIINEFNILDQNEVSKLIYRFRLGDDSLANRIWILVSLNKFLKYDKEYINLL